MTDEIEANAIDVELFEAVEGSQTSENGQGFALHARRRGGSGVMLIFPHSEISNIVENAAMQLAHGRDEGGQAVTTAFNASSFQLGKGPKGETVLSLMVGDTGVINFLLPFAMERQLHDALGRSMMRH